METPRELVAFDRTVRLKFHAAAEAGEEICAATERIKNETRGEFMTILGYINQDVLPFPTPTDEPPKAA